MEFRELLNRADPIILDGGMGTMLQAKGLALGEYPELAALEHPDVRYVRLNNLKQMSGEAKGQQALPYLHKTDRCDFPGGSSDNGHTRRWG